MGEKNWLHAILNISMDQLSDVAFIIESRSSKCYKKKMMPLICGPIEKFEQNFDR